MIDGFDRRRVRPYLCLLDGEDALSLPGAGGLPDPSPGPANLLHLSSIRKAWTLGRFIRNHRIDVMQTHFPDSTYFGVPAARLAGVPRVVRGRRDLGYWMRPLDRRLGRLTDYLVDATLVNSQNVLDSVLRDERPRPETVVVMENGVDLNRFESIPPLGSVGKFWRSARGGTARQSPRGERPRTVRCAAALVAGSHSDVSFAVAGEGELRPHLERLVRELGMAGSVRFLGSVNDVTEFLGRLGDCRALLAIGGPVQRAAGVHGRRQGRCRDGRRRQRRVHRGWSPWTSCPPGGSGPTGRGDRSPAEGRLPGKESRRAARRRVKQVASSLEVRTRQLQDFYRCLLAYGKVDR